VTNLLIVLLLGLGFILLLSNALPIVGGLSLAGGFALWLRRLHRLRGEEARARNPQTTDAYWKERSDKWNQERAKLWQRAQTDLRAAKELRKRVLEDLELNELAKQKFDPTPKSVEMANEVDRDLRSQLAQIDALIGSHSQR